MNINLNPSLRKQTARGLLLAFILSFGLPRSYADEGDADSSHSTSVEIPLAGGSHEADVDPPSDDIDDSSEHTSEDTSEHTSEDTSEHTSEKPPENKEETNRDNPPLAGGATSHEATTTQSEEIAEVQSASTGTLTINLPDTTATSLVITIKHYSGEALVPYSNTSFTVNGASKEFQRQEDGDNNYIGLTPNEPIKVSGVPQVTLTGFEVDKNSDDESDKHNNYDTIQIEVVAYHTDNLTFINFPTNNPARFNADIYERSMSGAIADSFPVNKSSTTFLTMTNTLDSSIKSSYDALFYMNYYNAISLNNIESTHIIGPIIALGHAARQGYSLETPTGGTLVFSERSQGFSSYVGTMVANPSNITESSIKLPYTYDDGKDGALAIYPIGTAYVPILFINETDQGVTQLTQNNTTRDYIRTTNNLAFPSPNFDATEGKVAQNDNFINQTSLTNSITGASQTLVDNGVLTGDSRTLGSVDYITVDVSSDLTDGSYTVTHGKSYSFINKSGNNSALKEIIIDFSKSTGYVDNGNGDMKEDGIFTYGVHADNNPTTINFMSGSLPTAKDTRFEIFPEIRYTDKNNTKDQLDTPDQGEGGEYFDLGNKVIWNLPYNTGYIAFAQQGINIIGHLIAPSATITNYTASINNNVWTVNTGSFAGGNINGIMIAKDIYSGSTEFHLWPYMTTIEIEEQAGSGKFNLSGLKTSNGAVEGFEFELSRIINNAISSTWKTTSDSDGKFTFDEIALAQGTHTFEVRESSIGSTVISYDKSVYSIEVTVSADSATTMEITKTHDENGVAVVTPSATISFHNTYTVTELPDTGGTGTILYTGFGLGLMVFALSLERKKFL